jgi:hypothetical protein
LADSSSGSKHGGKHIYEGICKTKQGITKIYQDQNFMLYTFF